MDGVDSVDRLDGTGLQFCTAGVPADARGFQVRENILRFCTAGVPAGTRGFPVRENILQFVSSKKVFLHLAFAFLGQAEYLLATVRA